MKVLKTSILSAMMVIVMMSFCGCASVGYSFVENASGSYEEIYTVAVQDEAIEAKGWDVTVVRAEIEAKMKEHFVAVSDRYRRILLLYNLPAGYEDKLTTSASWKDNVLSGVVWYESYEIYAKYYGIDPTVPTDWLIEKGAFVTKNYVMRRTIFATAQVGNEIFDFFTQMYGDIVAPEQNYYIYQYTTTSSKMRSDADYIMQINRETYTHIWLLRADEVDKEIMFYYVKPVVSSWYILALSCAGIFAAIYGVALYIHNKRQKKDKLNLEKLINDIYM